MVSPTLGNVMTDGKCKNTNIINELNIPLIAMGTENTVIAASSDGILVASKDESDKIKPLVDSLDMQVMYEEKSWGSYTVLDVGEDHLTIKAVLTKGHSMTYHSHRFRDEVWTITSGLGMAVIDGVKRDLAPGDVIKMKAGVKHMLKATTELHLTEVQIGKNISVSDKKKFELDLDE
jgi:mannose-1-phosphate guanylyltransferase